MVPAVSDRIPRVPPYSGGGSLLRSFPVRGCHPLCRAFPGASRSLRSRFLPLLRPRQRLDARGLGSVPFARHYSGHRCFFLFLRVLRCFSSPRSPLMNQVAGLQPAGLPHSDIRGSQPVCGSPRLFAAYHVLLRLRKPRHPPFALLSLPLNESIATRLTLHHWTEAHCLNSRFCLSLKLQSLTFATRKNSNLL
jgi:hypothetical protein